ncbi:endo alpha-1,4 polygalactosaminidase [Chloroflexus sp. Y-396-1]|uniref:endo alpha-1,4 polygalactosaminidase n=1 Tax=Chloroflexus sp. Y-396-1 TaxID=867845 RepID=UPI00048CC984|nr:endo alpha-1,4 polygalactosaminidase [Chloroflexus sp. Y-396-1]
MRYALVVGFVLAGLILSSCVSEVPLGVPLSGGSSGLPPTAMGTRHRVLPLKVSWQIQYTGVIDVDLNVEMFNLDLFDTPPDIIETLHQRGIFVMCYFSAGSYEDWRPDASQFPSEILGKEMMGWLGERWLDIRRLDVLAPVIEARLELAVQKGCDGVDPDNVNGYVNDSGFPLTYEDQLAYNIFLAQAAHARGLAIGLKNDLAQIPDLLPYFDWMLNEECFTFRECDQLLPFVQSGKPVFVIEYQLPPQAFCSQANQMSLNALHKNLELDAYRTDCQQFPSQ